MTACQHQYRVIEYVTAVEEHWICYDCNATWTVERQPQAADPYIITDRLKPFAKALDKINDKKRG